MSWQIRIPVRDPDEPVSEVAFDARVLDDPDERATVRKLVQRAMLDGFQTTGDLVRELGRLEREDPAKLRRVYDAAREDAGLETATEIDARQSLEARRAAVVTGPSLDGPNDQGGRLQRCSAEGCSAMPVDPMTGSLIVVQDRKWWCPEHAHLAGEHDHLPPADVGVITAGMQWIPAPSVQRAMQAADDRHREAREREAEGRRAEAEVARRARERWKREHERDPYYDPPVACLDHVRLGPGWPR